MIKKIMVAAAAAALMATPAWAVPSQAPPNQGTTHPSTVSGNTGNGHKPSNPGKSHKCKAHKVAYVAAGALVSQTLTQNADGTYNGEVKVEVTRTNHHASADKGKTVTYNLTNVRVSFGLQDTNNDGNVGLDDLSAGDRVRLIGKITALVKKCNQGEFPAETTIRHIVFHARASSSTNS